MAEYLTEINEDLTQDELDTLYGVGLLGLLSKKRLKLLHQKLKHNYLS